MADLTRMRKKRNDRGSGVQGVLVIDKPEGLTSHDVVQRVRRVYSLRQVGHAGTLDPIASGVLILLIGSATRIAQYLQEDDKEYHLVLKLGVETDTQDITGQILRETDPLAVTESALPRTTVSRPRLQATVAPIRPSPGAAPASRAVACGKQPFPPAALSGRGFPPCPLP